MPWNYRVVRRSVTITGGDGAAVEAVEFGIHEAYYRAGETEPYAITVDPVGPTGETLGELQLELLRFKAATEKPVLDYNGLWAWTPREGVGDFQP